MSVQRFHDAFSLDSARRRFFFKDDFLGDQLQDLWTSTGDVGGSGVVVDAETGGIVRLTTDVTLNDAWRITWNDIRSLLLSKNVCMEWRAKLGSASDVAYFNGLWEDSSDRVIFEYNTTMDNNIYASARQGGVTTSVDTGLNGDALYHTFRIETTSTSALYYIDDVLVATITTNLPDVEYLQPTMFLATRANPGAKTLDVDYIVCSQER